MSQPAPTHLLVIDNTQLAHLATKSELVSEFPFLNALRGLGKEGCAPCGRSNTSQSTSYNSVKEAIRALSGASLRRFKELVNAKQLRLVLQPRGGQRKPVEYTF